jgi:hypothetical protein
MDETRLEEAKKIVEEMQSNIDLQMVEEFIKNNRIEFAHKDVSYRVRLLNLKEKEELDRIRKRKFGELLADKNILMIRDIILLSRNRGIDIEKNDNEVNRLNMEITKSQIILGEAISKNDAQEVLENYSTTIQELSKARQILITQKILLVEYSLESSLETHVAIALGWLSLEKLQNDKWDRAYASFTEFQNESDIELIEKAGQYSALLQNNLVQRLF